MTERSELAAYPYTLGNTAAISVLNVEGSKLDLIKGF
jgi:hypothetical protein